MSSSAGAASAASDAPLPTDASTPAPSSTSLFDPALLPSHLSADLPPAYTLRPLHRSDFSNGFPDVLRVLTSVGNVSQSAWEARYDFMAGPGGRGTYFVLVVCDGEGRVVGTGALVVERKFIRDLGMVGHVEDIAVRRDQQGKKLGLRIIRALDGLAEAVGCYKTILDCSEANEGFYVKCGFRRAGLEMSHYYDRAAPPS